MPEGQPHVVRTGTGAFELKFHSVVKNLFICFLRLFSHSILFLTTSQVEAVQQDQRGRGSRGTARGWGEHYKNQEHVLQTGQSGLVLRHGGREEFDREEVQSADHEDRERYLRQPHGTSERRGEQELQVVRSEAVQRGVQREHGRWRVQYQRGRGVHARRGELYRVRESGPVWEGEEEWEGGGSEDNLLHVSVVQRELVSQAAGTVGG